MNENKLIVLVMLFFTGRLIYHYLNTDSLLGLVSIFLWLLFLLAFLINLFSKKTKVPKRVFNERDSKKGVSISSILDEKKARDSALNKLSLFLKGGFLLDEVTKVEHSNEYLISQRFHRLMKQFTGYDALFEKLYQLKQYLTNEEFSQAEELHSIMNEKKEVIRNYNENFVRERLEIHKSFFDGEDDGLEFPLDEQQRRAIVKDDKHNLVIAGAGSGKTEVLTTRIAYLTRRKDKIKPEKILALAFNKKAKEEIKYRLKKNYRIEKVNVHTFHSFGLSIIRETTGRKPIVIDGDKREERIKKIFKKKIKENKKLQNLFITYISNYLEEEPEEDSFTKKEEYYQYLKNKKYRTLYNKTVKSRGEVEVANYLFRNNIGYIYEEPARWGDEPFKPDFYLPEYDIYIEHWGIDEQGNTAPWINKEKYIQGMEWKKQQFRKHNKKLIETFHHESQKGRLEEKLKEKLSENQIELKKLPYDELVEKVYNYKKTRNQVAGMFSTFIKLAKSNHIMLGDLEQKIKQLTLFEIKKRTFAEMGLIIYRTYQKTLRENKEIDFEDMINKAIFLIKENKERYLNRYDHTLVDEFQDVSNQRVELIKTIVNDENNTKLFCVGDDWQSIYAFAGSEVRFFLDFQEHFSYPEKTFLEWSYRCKKTIVQASNTLIKNNIERVDKELKAKSTKEKQITLYRYPKYLGWQKYKVHQSNHALQKIREITDGGIPQEKILVISRFKFEDTIFDNVRIKSTNAGYNDVKYNTVHSCKGLEAKYVIILDVTSGRYGFPSDMTDDTIFDIVKTKTAKRNKKLDEERRLFYVALTRSKEHVYIYMQKGRESVFLNEINDYVEKKDIPSFISPKSKSFREDGKR